MTRACLLLCSLALLMTTATWAATDANLATLKATSERMDDGDAKSSGGNFTSSAVLEAGTADTKATISVVDMVGLASTKGPSYLRYQLRGEAPVDKGSTEDVNVGTVSGLTAGASVGGELSAIFWDKVPRSAVNELQTLCEQSISELVDGYDWRELSTFSMKDDVFCDATLFDSALLKEMVDGVNGLLKKCNENSPVTPTEAAICRSLKGRPPAKLLNAALDPQQLNLLRKRVLAITVPNAPAIGYITLGATANRQKYTFFDATDLSKTLKDQKSGYGVGLTLSRLSRNLLVSGGFGYEATYKAAGSPTQICAPVTNSVALTCSTATIGAPKKSIGRILHAEARWLVAPGKFALAARAEHDYEASKYALRVPLYLAPGKEKTLTGGIALGYTSKGKNEKKAEGFGASVFVGKAFSFD